MVEGGCFSSRRKSSSLSDDAQLDGETYFLVSPPSQLAFETLAGIQCAVADQAVLIYRQTEQVLRFCCADQFPTHLSTSVRKRAIAYRAKTTWPQIILTVFRTGGCFGQLFPTKLTTRHALLPMFEFQQSDRPPKIDSRNRSSRPSRRAKPDRHRDGFGQHRYCAATRLFTADGQAGGWRHPHRDQARPSRARCD